MRAVVALAVLLLATPAHAVLLEVHAGLRAGVATGRGLGGAQRDHDFFSGARGGAWGALIGLQVLLLDTRVEHTRFTEGGTFTQLVLGPRLTLPLGGRLHADLGAAAGFGFGTGRPIQGAPSDEDITDKGLLLELHAGLELRLARVVGVGVAVPVGWSYLWNSGVTDVSSHYTAFRAAVLGTVTIRFGL
jgi:hypothetical protein